MAKHLFESALNMLLGRLARQGKHGLVFTIEEDSTADANVEALLKFRVDALVLMAATLSSKLAEQCRAEQSHTGELSGVLLRQRTA